MSFGILNCIQEKLFQFLGVLFFLRWSCKSSNDTFRLCKWDLISIMKLDTSASPREPKMRISCHLLPIDSGRYNKIPRVERLCHLCNRSEIGDEFHYLLKCNHSSLSRIRGIFLESLYIDKQYFYEYVLQGTVFIYHAYVRWNIINLLLPLILKIL